jgi:stage VI sporulation protein D
LAEQQNGLRFDIYERVHLSEGVAGIKELEDVELVPHIQVVPQGDQALLRGNLLLSGTYVDEQDTVNRTLEHLIPVEITLPLNRVQRVEDIAVEIENFDVDILSARSLNITGVLSLNGLEPVNVPVDRDVWEEAEEEVLFVNEVQTSLQPDTAENPLIEAEHHHPARERYPAPPPDISSRPNNWAVEDVQEQEQEQEEEPWLEEDNDDSLEVFQQQPIDTNDVGFVPEEKKELKIAFTGKQPEESKPVKPIGLTSLLQSASSVKAEQRAAEADAAAAVTTPGDRLEWKKLLLNSTNEQQEFRRLRLCIVQKEETLETIAKRYELNPREIALFNRLPENEVSEGQIVYIPK